MSDGSDSIFHRPIQRPAAIPETLPPSVQSPREILALCFSTFHNSACPQYTLSPIMSNSFEHHRCAWPTQLELELNQSEGTFVQRWQVYAESWVKLPGVQNQWPQDITLNGKPVPVLEREGRPALSLVPGKHALRGHFFWERLPESIAIPQDTGIVALKLNGKSVAYPLIEDGALWLREREAGRKAREGAGDRLDLQVFRRVIDEVPLELITRVEIDVAGDPRAILLGTALLPGLIPLRLD